MGDVPLAGPCWTCPGPVSSSPLILDRLSPFLVAGASAAGSGYTSSYPETAPHPGSPQHHPFSWPSTPLITGILDDTTGYQLNYGLDGMLGGLEETGTTPRSYRQSPVLRPLLTKQDSSQSRALSDAAEGVWGLPPPRKPSFSGSAGEPFEERAGGLLKRSGCRRTESEVTHLPPVCASLASCLTAAPRPKSLLDREEKHSHLGREEDAGGLTRLNSADSGASWREGLAALQAITGLANVGHEEQGGVEEDEGRGGGAAVWAVESTGQGTRPMHVTAQSPSGLSQKQAPLLEACRIGPHFQAFLPPLRPWPPSGRLMDK